MKTVALIATIGCMVCISMAVWAQDEWTMETSFKRNIACGGEYSQLVAEFPRLTYYYYLMSPPACTLDCGVGNEAQMADILEISKSLGQSARIQEDLKNYKMAAMYLEQLRAVQEDILMMGKSDPNIMDTFSDLIRVYEKMGDKSKAQRLNTIAYSRWHEDSSEKVTAKNKHADKKYTDQDCAELRADLDNLYRISDRVSSADMAAEATKVMDCDHQKVREAFGKGGEIYGAQSEFKPNGTSP